MANRFRGRAKTLNALAPVYDLDQFQYQSLVTEWLRKEVANDRSPVKHLAKIAGTSTAAAKHWYGGRATPSGLHLSRLRSAFPQFDSELRRLEGMEHDHDPLFERALNEFIARRIQEREK